MPRMCVLCGKQQDRSFSVFSFPSSFAQRAAWIGIVRESKPEFADKKLIPESLLKNGICELHFFPGEISKGKKRRLSREAIPSLDISPSQKCRSIIKMYRKSMFLPSPEEVLNIAVSGQENFIKQEKEVELLSNTESVDGVEKGKPKDDSLLDFTFQIEIEDRGLSSPKVHKSLVDNIFREEDKGFCLCCGFQNPICGLFSVLKCEKSGDDKSLLDELSCEFKIPKEEIIGHSTFVCRKCLKIIENLLELKRHFNSLLSRLKSKFLITSKNLEIHKKRNSYLEVNVDKRIGIVHVEMDGVQTSESSRKSTRLSKIEKKFPCYECSGEFDTLGALSQHQKSHEDEDKNDVTSSGGGCKTGKTKNHCPVCNKSFSTKGELKCHLKSHRRNYDCPECGRLITSEARLKYHLFKFHGIGKEKEKTFRCKLCDCSSSSKAGLRYHEWSVHKVGKPFTCEICQKVFNYRMLYNSHKLFAHGKKNIVCEVCGEMFFTVAKLNVHINAIHRNAKSWICKICEEKFTTTSAYRHHVIVRHKQIFHKCSHCDAKFKKKYSLTQHLWKHGIYRCQRCSTNFEDSATYVVHMFEVHKIDASRKFRNNASTEHNVKGNAISPDNSTQDSSSVKKGLSPIVINDILMASNNFDNSNLQPLTFQSESKERVEKSNFELATVAPIHFSNVDGLEIESVTNESIELEEDVSLINVQMLDDIHDVTHHSNLKPLKTDILASSDKTDYLTISNPLQGALPVTAAGIPPSTTQLRQKIDDASPDTNNLSKITIINDLTQSPVPAPVCKPTNEDSLSVVDPLVQSQLEEPSLVELPSILQPIKNTSWNFSNTLSEHSDPNIDPVIHSLTVENDLREADHPVTREIGITIPSEDEETKIASLPNPISDTVVKMDDQELPSLAVDIDVKEVHYVYFGSSIEKC